MAKCYCFDTEKIRNFNDKEIKGLNNETSIKPAIAVTLTTLQAGFILNDQQVLPATGEVFLASGVQTLEPKVMAVLLVLVRSIGQPVSAEQIFAEVWPRSVYNPIAVRRSINQLRNLFQDTDKSLIRTHPKRGYALHARLAQAAKTQAEPQQAAELTQPAETLHGAPVSGITKDVLPAHTTPADAGAANTGPANPGPESTAPANTTAPQRRPQAGALLATLKPFALWLVPLCLLISGFWWLKPAPVSQPTRWQVSALQPLTASKAEESFSLYTPDSSAVVYLRHSNQAGGASALWLAPNDGQQHRLLYQSKLPIKFFAFIAASDETLIEGQVTAPARSALQLVIAHELAGAVQFFRLQIADTLLSGPPASAEPISNPQIPGAPAAVTARQSVPAPAPAPAPAQIQATTQQSAQLTPLLTLADSSLFSPFFVANQQLYFLARQQGEQRLFQADLTTGQLSLLLAPSHQFSPYRIAPAPQQQIALLGFDHQQRSQIKLLTTDTATLTDYKTLDANWYFLAYHQAGQGYLLSDGKALFYLDNTRKISPLTFENYAFIHYPALSPDGRHISYTRADIQGDLFSLQWPDEQPQPLTASSRHNWQGSFSPDGKRLAYVSNKHGHSQIFLKDLASQQEWLLYANSDQQLALSQPIWSADGQQLAFARNQRLVLIQLSDNGQPNTSGPQGESRPPDPEQRQYMGQELDQVLGQPVQWLSNPARLLLRQPGQPASRWLLYDVASQQLQALGASNHTLFFSAGHWFEADAQQLRILSSPLTAATATAAPLQLSQGEAARSVFTADEHQRIVRQFVKAEGIYLLLTGQPAAGQTSVWFVSAASQQAVKVADVPLSAQQIWDLRDISLRDIAQAQPQQQHTQKNRLQILYSQETSEKDIQTLRFSKVTTE